MRLRTLALVSGVYDLLLGLPMLLAAPQVARLFGAPEPVPVVNAWLNGVFALDHFLNGSPPAFLLFAATDGTLALLTLALLRRQTA
jgi:hypothetical protein